jgi:hypothetical protein
LPCFLEFALERSISADLGDEMEDVVSGRKLELGVKGSMAPDRQFRFEICYFAL